MMEHRIGWMMSLVGPGFKLAHVLQAQQQSGSGEALMRWPALTVFGLDSRFGTA
jgi:hypothetical protein